MKRKIAFLIVLSFVFSSLASFSGYSQQTVIAAPVLEKVNITNATVTQKDVNLRQGPSKNYPIVCILKKDTVVKVLAKTNGWYAVVEPQRGFVGMISADFLKIHPIASPKATPPPISLKTPLPVPKTPVPMPKAPTPTKAPPHKMPSPTIPNLVLPTSKPIPQDSITADEKKVLDLVNKARSDARIGLLQVDMNMMKVARLKAKDMVDKNYFSHQSPTYGSPFDMMRQFGITFTAAGENIAGNQTAEGAFASWMNSEGHRKNILNANYNSKNLKMHQLNPLQNCLRVSGAGILLLHCYCIVIELRQVI
jgi:uncharacterized YkwD family protein